MKAPDVLGVAEAADALGLVGPRIPRLRSAGRFPEPAADLRATPVWTREQIKAFKRNGTILEASLDLVGTAEAADILAVKKTQIGRWMRAGNFPEPFARVKAGPLWLRQDVVKYVPRRRSLS